MVKSRKKGTLKLKITKAEIFIQSVTNLVENEFFTALKVKLCQMEGMKENLAKHRKEYFTIFLQQTDIFEAGAVLEDIAERLKNIKARLKTFSHKLKF